MPPGRYGLGTIHQDIFAIGVKNENLVGQSRIGVFIVGFSLIGALKRHAPLVFSSNRDLEEKNPDLPILKFSACYANIRFFLTQLYIFI